MPFTYRDNKPRLSERLRGKSGEEILNELKSDLNTGRRMFFDSPSWGTRENISGFPRGFPFDEDRDRTHFKSYFDNLANRHPEFADRLKDPDWGDEFGNSFPRKRRSSGTAEEEKQSGSSEQPIQEEEEEPRQQNLNQFGLRNTVPLAQNTTNAEEERNKRSMSAPPDNRTADKPKRFVTKCEIPMHDPTQDQGKPPMAPKAAPEQAQKSGNQPNVRVIPIQVEGRDEPVINANIDTSANFGAETYRDPVFEGRLPRDFGNYQQHSPRFTKKERVPTPQPQPQQQKQPQPQPQPQPSQPDETDSRPKPQAPQPKDPLSKVQVIQKEVNELSKQVESFEGTSRKDKQYMILDELLTRKLISLDDIETEGKENVRQARKDAIRSIQRCISMLESKVPPVENNQIEEADAGKTEEQPMEVDGKQVDQSKQSMEVDQTKGTTDAEEPQAKKEKTEETSNGEQKMEVETDNKTVQEKSSDNAK